MSIKNKLYNFFVCKNGRVRYEYERYVMEHINEHNKCRIKHIWILLKLNWFYRVKKGNTPYLYWDEPLNPNFKRECVKKKIFYPESKVAKREKVDELVEKLSKYDIICFDVYDTLIFRVVNNPNDVFYLLGMQHKIPDFENSRKKALVEARNVVGNHDVTLDDIYDVLQKQIGNQILKNDELEMEKAVSYANPFLYEVVLKLIDMGKKVITVSDMYLNGEQISNILSHVGYPKLEVYSSSDFKKNKKNGELQVCVREIWGNDKSYIFIGNDYDSDFKKSIEIGMDAYWYKTCKDIGKSYRSIADKGIEGSVYNAIINNAVHCGNFKHDIFFEHGFVYGGIIVYGFCEWIEELVQKYKFDKFIFLSRDMDIFYKAYNKYFNSISSEYVSFSRFASQQLIFEDMTEEYLVYTIRTRINKNSITETLTMFDLPLFEEELLQYNLTGKEKLNDDNYNILREIIYTYKDIVLEKFKPAIEGAKKYYSDMLGDSKSICVLDLGWKGTAVVYLSKLFEKWGFDVKTHGAIVSVSGNSYAQSVLDSGILDVYIKRNEVNFTVGVPKGANFEMFRGHMFEATFSSEEDSLLEYGIGQENFVYGRKNPNTQIIKSIQEGILEFCNEYFNRTKNIRELLRINGFTANTPINKALKQKEYLISTWAYVLDEASGESGFSKEPKYKTFFQIMKNAKMVSDKDLINSIGVLAESEKIFICSTYSQVFITLIRVLGERESNIDIIIYDDIPNSFELFTKLRELSIFNNIMIFTKEGLPQRFYPAEKDKQKLKMHHYKHMLAVEKKLQVDLKNYKEVYTYYDGHHLGLYLQEKHIKYHLIEDGMNHFQHIHATPSSQEIPVLTTENIKGYAEGWKYLCCGQNPDCLSIEVNENKDLAIKHNNIIEKPRHEMKEKLSVEDKRIISRVFITDFEKLLSYKNRLAIVFTSVLVNDGWVDTELTQIKIYREIIDELKMEGYYVVIKPHPRDKVIYNKVFNDCFILERMFPSEILDFDKRIHFEKGVVIASSAMELLKCIDVKVKLGFKHFEKYKAHVAPWVLESLEHPENYNW